MRRTFRMMLLIGFVSLAPFGRAPASSAVLPAELVDRIVARVEDDIIMLSEVRELAAYQQLVEGRAEPDDQILHELIEQWVVRGEAEQAQFPMPTEAEVNREISQIQSRFPNLQDYTQRLGVLGVTPEAVRRVVERQIYLARYLDYKFRPAVQVEDAAVSTYYDEELVPALRTKGQAPPSLDTVSDQIRELLVQRGISERAASWFEETKSRLRIEVQPVRSANETP
jgi:SurA N-terminal domain